MNPEAQLAYWKARFLLDHSIGDLEVYRKAIQYSEQAVRIDPNYAPAHAALAWAHAQLINVGAFPREVMPAAEAGLQRGTLVMPSSERSLPVLVAAANMLAMVFLDSQSTNYDSRNSSASLTTFNIPFKNKEDQFRTSA